MHTQQQHIRNNDFDTPWKEALEQFFPEFMEMFFPEAAEAIDWSAGHQFLDKELQQIVRDAELGKRFADKLVQVRLRHQNAQQLILLHLEIQGQPESTFAKRMFVYYYRLFDRYDCRIASMALLTDEHPQWRPNEYHAETLGCEVSLRFPVRKLRDLEQQWSDLEASNNPFAVVAMAHLKAQQTRGDMEARLRWKLHIARALYRKDFSKTTVLALVRFLDWLVTLPPVLQEQFTTTVHHLEDTSMPYYADFELVAMNKGLQQGLQQGLRKSVTTLLTKKFPDHSAALLPMLENINDPEYLEHLVEVLLVAQSPEDAQRALASAPAPASASQNP